MKKLLIRLTGLMVTAAIVMSCSGIALADETEGLDGSTGVTSEEPVDIPDEEEPEKAPAKEESPAPAEDPYGKPAEDPSKEEAQAPAEDPDKKPVEVPAGEPAADSATAEESVNDVKAPEKTAEETGTIDVKPDFDNDALAEGYINKVFGSSVKKRSRSSFDYESLLEDQQSVNVYRRIRDHVSNLAAGTETHTKLDLPDNTLVLTYTASDLGVSNFSSENNKDKAKAAMGSYISNIIGVLLQSNPYELYWYDKTKGVSYSFSTDNTGDTITFNVISIVFAVAKDYQIYDENHVSSEYGANAIAARDNAMEIVATYSELDDYKKLKAYKNKICELTDYNEDAITATYDKNYKNPWQMVWVFDGDPDTKVVCEGYSKAFQFLCENTHFQSPEVYALSVTGLNGQSKLVGHMWNIVHMDDGNYYIVDVTNCDTGWNLFLRGKSDPFDSSGLSGYIIRDGNESLAYLYDGNTVSPELAEQDYTYDPNPGPITEPVFTNQHAMILAGKLGLKFLVDFPDNYDGSDCYIIFTSSDGRTSRVNYSESETGENFGNKRAFTFYMNPLELADTVTATLHYGEDKTRVDVCSVISYINDARNSTLSNDYWLMNLLYKLQAYGYYLQNSGWTDGKNHAAIPYPFTTLNEDNIPQTVITDESLSYTVNQVSSYNYSVSAGSLIADVRFALTLNSQTELRVAVKPAADVTVTSDASDYSVERIGGDDYYVFTIKDIGPKKLGNNQVIVINTDQGEVRINVPVMYYVKLVLGSSSFETGEKNAMIAYYNYYHAAMNYNK